VSKKTIARALKHTLVVMSRNNKVNVDSRGQVSFPKGETIRKAEYGLDVESLQQEINTLKTMYEVQEKTRERHKKNVQGALDSIRMLIQTQGQSRKETESPPMRFGQGSSQMGLPSLLESISTTLNQTIYSYSAHPRQRTKRKV